MMSDNKKDFDIIKQTLNGLDNWSAHVGKAKIVVDAAERQTSRIEECEVKIQHLYDVNAELAQCNSEMTFKINYLTAELKERPHIVRCNKCRKHKTNECMIVLMVGRCYFTNPSIDNHTPDDFYCAYGDER